jgi:hypothetical protein
MIVTRHAEGMRYEKFTAFSAETGMPEQQNPSDS